MSLDKRKELSEVAKKLCRELRINQTPSEKLIWDRIRNRQLFGKKFLRQHPIFYDLNGKETFYISDFFCYELKLVIEVDGQIHKYKKRSDADRDRMMNYLGIIVFRITNEKVLNNLEDVLTSLINIIIKLDNSP